MGGIMCSYGIFIYYVMPLSLVSFNAHLLLIVIFIIAIGYFCGLAILSMNLIGGLEYILLNIFLVWEKSSMKQLVLKNLVAHKERNQLTSLVYALTLGVVIFIVVLLALNLQIFQMIHKVTDATFFIEAQRTARTAYDELLLDPSLITPIMLKHKATVEDYAFTT